MRNQIEGFDYRTGKPVVQSARAWKEEQAAIIKAGGRRRVEAGETFLHGKDGLIAVEIYTRLGA